MVGIPMMVFVAVAAVWILLRSGLDRDGLDAIRTGGTLGVGLGGGVVLWLAVRRQRSTEVELLQKHEAHQLAMRIAAHNEAIAAANQAHQQQVAKAAQDDAAERRITELYTKAADQLGSDKAPVRLAGLYALERLAQDTPRLRQTIVNVLCAYLRMPYTLPTTSTTIAPRLGQHRNIRPGHPLPPIPQPKATLPSEPADTARQESEVRTTAQSILAAHLRPGSDPDQPAETFWPSINLNLVNATLIALNLSYCRIDEARFYGAQFAEGAEFKHAEFTAYAGFNGAQFYNYAGFAGARFADGAEFERAQFTGRAVFVGAQVNSYTWFERAKFTGNVTFENARFTGHTEFDDADFAMNAVFECATFAGDVTFQRTRFAGHTRFQATRFAGRTTFHDTEFAVGALFQGATFNRTVPSEVAQFLTATPTSAAPSPIVDRPTLPTQTTSDTKPN